MMIYWNLLEPEYRSRYSATPTGWSAEKSFFQFQ